MTIPHLRIYAIPLRASPTPDALLAGMASGRGVSRRAQFSGVDGLSLEVVYLRLIKQTRKIKEEMPYLYTITYNIPRFVPHTDKVCFKLQILFGKRDSPVLVSTNSVVLLWIVQSWCPTLHHRFMSDIANQDLNNIDAGIPLSLKAKACGCTVCV